MRLGHVALLSAALCVAACDESSGAKAPSAGADAAVARSPDPAAVRAAFERFRDAVVAKDGATAAALLDRQSLEHFERAKRLALTANEAELQRAPLMEQVSALRMRLSHDAAGLEARSARQLAEEHFAHGYTGSSGLATLRVGEVTGEGGRALAAMVTADGKPTPLTYEFRDEDGWKFVFVGPLRALETSLKMLQAQTGIDSKRAVLRSLSGAGDGGTLPESLFRPLRAADGG